MINVRPVPVPGRSRQFLLNDPPHSPLLDRLATLVHRAAWPIAIIAVLSAMAGAIYVVRNVDINTDTSQMLSPRLEFLRVEAEMDAAFPRLSENLIVVVESDTPERTERAASRLATAMSKRADLFPSVYHPQTDPFFSTQRTIADLHRTA
jgi:uncharacterized membrane protein YdfJ with MMPL/SSD domain